MKNTLLILTLLSGLLLASDGKNFDSFLKESQTIVFGKICYITPTSVLTAIDWEFKGLPESSVIEIQFDGNTDFSDLQQGDRLLVFINRALIKPIEKIDDPTMRYSKFDPLDGQIVFKVIGENDYCFVNNVYSKVYPGENEQSNTF